MQCLPPLAGSDRWINFPDGKLQGSVIPTNCPCDVSSSSQGSSTQAAQLRAMATAFSGPSPNAGEKPDYCLGLTQEELNAFLVLNYLMRPPITNAEIRCLPVAEALGLYYSCNAVHECRKLPNPLLNVGLPLSMALEHDEALQNRIYLMRPDLRVAYDAKGTPYQILLSPDQLQAPNPSLCKGTNWGMTITLGVVSIFAGPLVSAIVSVAQTAYTSEQSLEMARAVNRLKSTGGQLANALTVATTMIPDPVPDQQTLATLAASYRDWQNLIAQYSPVAEQVLIKASRLPPPYDALARGPATIQQSIRQSQLVSGNGNWYDSEGIKLSRGRNEWMAGFAGNLAYYWQPYSEFFWSQTVKEMIMNPKAAAAGQVMAQAKLEDQAGGAVVAGGLGGLGLGALLLLLL